MKQLANLNLTLETISKDLNISKTQINKYLDSYITIPPRPLPVSIGIDELLFFHYSAHDMYKVQAFRLTKHIPL